MCFCTTMKRSKTCVPGWQSSSTITITAGGIRPLTIANRLRYMGNETRNPGKEKVEPKVHFLFSKLSLVKEPPFFVVRMGRASLEAGAELDYDGIVNKVPPT